MTDDPKQIYLMQTILSGYMYGVLILVLLQISCVILKHPDLKNKDLERRPLKILLALTVHASFVIHMIEQTLFHNTSPKTLESHHWIHLQLILMLQAPERIREGL